MDLVPSINPDDDVPDFEDGDDELAIAQPLFATSGSAAPLRARKSDKRRAPANVDSESEDGDDGMDEVPISHVVGKKAVKLADKAKVQSAWSFKDTIARIDATTRQSSVVTSLQDKIQAVLKKQQHRAKARAAQETQKAQAQASAQGKAEKGTGKRKRSKSGSDEEDIQIEEVTYDDDEDDDGEDDDEEDEEEEDDEDEGSGEEDEDEDEENVDAAEGDSESEDQESDEDASDAGEANDEESAEPDASDAMDEEAAEAADEEGAEAADQVSVTDENDVDALFAASKPNPYKAGAWRAGKEGGKEAGMGMGAKGTDPELERQYKKFFEADPFAAQTKAGKKNKDAVRALQAGVKGALATNKTGSAQAHAGAGAGGEQGAVSATLPSSEPQTWTEMNLSRPLLRAVQALGYTTPTPIQKRTIPLSLAGRDLCASAVTGSGKSAAYLLPILERLLYKPAKVSAIRVLILVPTRELAAQVHSMAQALSQFCTSPPLRIALVVGGVSLQAQSTELRSRPDIVVATPGRILDHIRNSLAVHTDDVDVLVLDEADRLLEMGFEAEVQEIVKACPVGRQTLLFSATMTARVESLVKLSLRKPVRVTTDPLYDMANKLVQEFVRLRPGRDGELDREAVVLALVTRSFTGGGVLVFTTHKLEAHKLAILLGLAQVKAAELHGNLTQKQRLEALESFRTGESDVLVATDLAGRGLDIAGVRIVINAQMPREMTAYVHRVGRTARAGRAGVAVSLVSDDSRPLMREIVKRAALNVRSRVVPAEVLAEWRKQVQDWEEAVSDVLQAERDERELRMAEMEVTKADNLLEHRDEIEARPARSWFQSEKQKAALKEQSKAAHLGAKKKSKEEGGEGAEADASAAGEQAGKAAKRRDSQGREVEGHRMSRKKRRRLAALQATEVEAKRVSRLEAQQEKERKASGVGAPIAGKAQKRSRSEGNAAGHGGEEGEEGGSSSGGAEMDRELARKEQELRRAKKKVEAATLATTGQHLLAKSAKARMRELQAKTGMTGRRVAKLVLAEGGAQGKGKKKQKSREAGAEGATAGGSAFGDERLSLAGRSSKKDSSFRAPPGGRKPQGGKGGMAGHKKASFGSKSRHKKRR